MAYQASFTNSNISSSNSNDNLRLNYLYPCGDAENYGRKLYIFSSAPPSFTGPAHSDFSIRRPINQPSSGSDPCSQARELFSFS
ncbi:hypothetical protein ElyMa_002477200 [Elysia marginata]|uniref:Uncharacterized protein n=1 Tax=Elysia marginata TaxID=1093978 RepID=A0AAV4GR68_9GAST|nr:hypothetical protein ElyMa_002477200 [Elysia marginata]